MPPGASPAASPGAPLLARDDVVAGYRWILGRAPENEALIARRLAAGIGPAQLREELLASGEFRATVRDIPPALAPEAPALAVDLGASPAELHAMLHRARWARLRQGEVAPFAGAPEEPEALAVGDARRRYHAAGRADRRLLEGALARLGLPRGFRRLVDFGCGAGRATLHLAAICPVVTGVDASPLHLALAREEAAARGLDHIGWRRATPERPMPVEACDIWFSRGVLQDHPPPVIRHLLALGFASVAPGGIAAFQVPTYGAGYRFGLAEELAGARPGPGPHALPQAEVFALAAAAGLVPLEVNEDPLPGLDRGRWVSHFCVLRRPV